MVNKFFDRSKYSANENAMTESNIMQGKICLITGATSGIGKETAKNLAKAGANVLIVGRNPEKTKEVVEEIKNFSGSQNVDYFIADLSLMGDVRKLAESFKLKYNHLDVLMNNAGAVTEQKIITKEGLESTFALNHLSYFLLTNLLIKELKASSSARIINVSSSAHQGGKIDFDNLQGEKNYNGLMAYAKSKLENILFTKKLAKLLEGTKVTVNALHPGKVATNFGKSKNSSLFWKIISPFFSFGSISVEEGAKTPTYLASSSEVEGVSGKYFYKCEAIEPSQTAFDVVSQEKLWEVSKSLVQV